MEGEKTNDVLTKPCNDLGLGDNTSKDKRVVEGGEVSRAMANSQPQEGIMPWMQPEEVKDLEHVQKIRNAIVASEGLMTPEANQRALGFITHYYERATERAAKAKAMRDEYFSNLLTTYPDLAIGRAKAMAEGSEFGRKRTFYKNQAEGYLEIMQSLKKNIAYFEGKARNQW